VLAAQPVTTNLLKFMRASIKMIGVSNLQSFIASMTQKLTLSDISDESKNYLDKAGITTACLRIKSKWTAGEIGRASCRERVEVSVVGGTAKRKRGNGTPGRSER